MVLKTEGAKMTCKNCQTHLVCHSKTYPASDKYPEKTVMQWQNQDGSAHYSTNNGKDFSCNVPEEQPQTAQQEQTNRTLNEYEEDRKLSNEDKPKATEVSTALIYEKQELILECISAMFRIFVDLQLAKKENLPEFIKKQLEESDS